MDKISIVSTIYNKGPWLERFFDTILNQTYQNIEIVAVNNASTDDSLEIVEKYAAKDSRVKVVQIEVNNGPSNGFKAGINAVTGEYFTIIDADDYIDTDYIEKLYSAIKSEDADVSMCVNDLIWDNGRRRHKQWPKEKKYVIEGGSVIKLPMQMLDELSDDYLGFHMPEIGAVWCKMYKTSFIKDNHLNFENNFWIWCDFVFNLYVMKKVRKMVYITTTCYHFYQSEDSLTRPKDMQIEQKKRVLMAMGKIFEGCKDIMTPELEKASNRFYFNLIRYIANYFFNFVPDVLPAVDFNSIVHEMVASPGGKQLFSSNNLPKMSFREKLFMYAYKHSKTILVYKLDRCYLMTRSIASKLYRLFK